jgi:hypothetical protein
MKTKPDVESFLNGAAETKIISSKEFNLEEAKLNPISALGLKAPLQVNKLTYDSSAEALEPIYFWILDFVGNLFRSVDKITDNFVASPGSQQFTEWGTKATRMQEEAMKAFGTVNTVLKSVLNILYDMKEFKLRLDTYDDYKQKDNKDTKNSALLSLKQIWLDSVDIKRGNTSLKGMLQQFDYVTIVDAFMKADSLADVTKHPDQGGLDLNDRVRRLLQQRLGEFFRWVEESEKELRKRFEIEKRYLESQYNALQLYSRWIRPYLEAARKLEQNATPNAGLVTPFNTSLLELTLLCKSDYDPKDDVKSGDLPRAFETAVKRKYTSVLVIEFKFRGRPVQGSFVGKTEITFTTYGLNDQELKVLAQELEKDNLDSVMKEFIQGATTDSIGQIKEDIEKFLGKKKEEPKKEEKKQDDSNPFSALFSFFFESDKKKEDKKEDLSKGIRPDDSYEKIARSQAIIGARDKCNTIFDTYKKAHQMPAYP